MKRIHMHWTGGNHKPNAVDLKAYHFVTDGDGVVHDGELKPEANLKPLGAAYTAHTKGANTDAIGTALGAMWGAVESPFATGEYPVTMAQLIGFIDHVADLYITYKIKVTRKTVLTHAEIETELGVAQNNKWDITWLPTMKEPTDATMIGDQMRLMVSDRIAAKQSVSKAAGFIPARTNPIQSSTNKALGMAGLGTIMGYSEQAKKFIGDITVTFGIDAKTVLLVIILAGISWAAWERWKRWKAGDK